ncbi:unnamed protein product [Amaranthus hypochondriacus]
MAESRNGVQHSNCSLHLHPRHPPSTIDTIHNDSTPKLSFLVFLFFSSVLFLFFSFCSTGRLKCRSRSRPRTIQSVNVPRLGSIEPDRGSHAVPSIPATLGCTPKKLGVWVFITHYKKIKDF